MKNFLRPLLFVFCALSATLFAEESAPAAAAPVPAAPALTPAEEERSPSAVVPTAPALAAPSSEDEGVPEFAKKHAHELDENGTWARGCNCDDH